MSDYLLVGGEAHRRWQPPRLACTEPVPAATLFALIRRLDSCAVSGVRGTRDGSLRVDVIVRVTD